MGRSGAQTPARPSSCPVSKELVVALQERRKERMKEEKQRKKKN